MPQNMSGLILAASTMFAVLAAIAALSNYHSLNIKAKTVGHGQHGTARWATRGEIVRTYTQVDFTPERWQEGKLAYKARAEKYAKIISKTIIMSGGDSASYGQNAFFYDAAEGLLTSAILLVAEFCEPAERHIVSIFKIIQELLAPSGVKGKTLFHILMDSLPSDHKARWFAGAALSSSEQAMASVMSTALARLNSFLDSEAVPGAGQGQQAGAVCQQAGADGGHP